MHSSLPASIHLPSVQGCDARGAAVVQHGQGVGRLDLHHNLAPGVCHPKAGKVQFVQQNGRPQRLSICFPSRPVSTVLPGWIWKAKV